MRLRYLTQIILKCLEDKTALILSAGIQRTTAASYIAITKYLHDTVPSFYP